MGKQLTEQDARESLTDHARSKGRAVRARYGPDLDWDALTLLLGDREFVRYPCEVVFDGDMLLEGEVSFPEQISDLPESGFRLALHPGLVNQKKEAVAAVLYQLVVVNYGNFATSTDAEAFGAACLGVTEEEFYQRMCNLVDTL